MHNIIYVKKSTILSSVEDIKVVHVDPDGVKLVMEHIDSVQGKIYPITVTRVKMHNYIGMNIYFTYNGKIHFIMIDYIINILEEQPYDMRGEASPAAGEQIFVVNEENPTKISEKYTVMFCHNTTKLLFLENKVRPEIQLSVSFL